MVAKVIRSRNIRTVPLPPTPPKSVPHQHPPKETPKTIVQKAVRPRPIPPNSEELYRQINSIASMAGSLQTNWPATQEPKSKMPIIKPTPPTPPDFYLGFGGLGDALLLLASCWDNPNAYVIFFANSGSLNFIEEFFKLFDIKYFLHRNIMGQQIAGKIFNLVTSLPTFKTSAHLADRLYHGDWLNHEKYSYRITKSAPWKEKFGKIEISMPITTICPSGSERHAGRQRFLSQREYQALLQKYKDHMVYVIGSRSDFAFYGIPSRPNLQWLTSNEIISSSGNGKSIALPHMLKMINSSERIISVDTWLKTYALLVGIPATVIRTRWNGQYKEYGQDATDYIFLNKDIWPEINFAKIEELI